ncbi:iron uptake porin [Synechococcus sp. MU1642]|uniref:iron uptake porin n=1 Tax=Synechococcus sp. MU1642 TaxID=2508348 RepID=UPI001CF82542|nr:iron uptake porin [Synechococcus sp. MU1642]MCB4406480.1 iron uptake porin [Synechococcus sp. MU1642]
MKLFQQLLVAPAALGLLATGANAAELNINGVSDYAASADQVTSVTQFSDVYPTDWAYQALAGLVETYGCVAGYPNGTFRGNRAMTRYEAAALLNACLDRVTEVTDELRRLMAEFETELAIIKGRVDGLEARVGELEATQFSTTTKLKGQADFFIGAVSYEDRDDCNAAKAGECEDDATSFSYRYTLNLNTTFSGKDLLYTRIRTGNMSNVWTQDNSYLSDAKSGTNALKIDKLWYTFPVGDEFKVTVGALVENYYMVETPTRYKPILKAFKLGGYGIAMGASTGQGAGIQWRQNVAPGEAAWNAAISYVADGNEGASSSSKKGLFGEDTDGLFLSQIGYGNRKWYISGLYAHKQGEQGSDPAEGYSTPAVNKDDAALNAFAIRGYWSPEDSGLMPTVSAGIDFGFNDAEADGQVEESFGWMVGLNWKNAFIDGNKLGVAFGSYSSYATEMKGDSDPDDENFAIEAYYDYQVSDNITVTPAIFWIEDADGAAAVDGSNRLGGLIKTTFKF